MAVPEGCSAVAGALALQGERSGLCPGRGARWARRQHPSLRGNSGSLAVHNLQKGCSSCFQAVQAPSRCPEPQASEPAPCSPSLCPFSEKPSPSARCNGRRRFLGNFQGTSQFPEVPPSLLLLVLCPISFSRNPVVPRPETAPPRCCRAGGWCTARFDAGDLSPSCLLFLCPSSSAAPPCTRREQSLSGTCGMETDVGCQDSARREPSLVGCCS